MFDIFRSIMFYTLLTTLIVSNRKQNTAVLFPSAAKRNKMLTNEILKDTEDLCTKTTKFTKIC